MDTRPAAASIPEPNQDASRKVDCDMTACTNDNNNDNAEPTVGAGDQADEEDPDPDDPEFVPFLRWKVTAFTS